MTLICCDLAEGVSHERLAPDLGLAFIFEEGGGCGDMADGPPVYRRQHFLVQAPVLAPAIMPSTTEKQRPRFNGLLTVPGHLPSIAPLPTSAPHQPPSLLPGRQLTEALDGEVCRNPGCVCCADLRVRILDR